MSDLFDNGLAQLEKRPSPRRVGEFLAVKSFGSVAVTNAAAVDVPGAVALAGRRALRIRNEGAGDCRIGGADVSTTKGALLKAGEVQDFLFGEGVDVKAIATTATATTLGGYEAC